MKRRGAGREIAAVCRALERDYGPLPPRKCEPPLSVLVATILSQNTSDINSQRAYRNLRRRFPGWAGVAAAEPRAIEAAIHCGGLAKIKAARIRAVLRLIREREGRLSLARLKTMRSADALAWLTGLPGVGVKTACCVLLFGLGRPVMPVDTHVYRIAGRLGWVRPKMPVDAVHVVLERLIPPRWILPVHLHLIAHGRRICRPRRPRCGECPLARHCAFFNQAGAWARRGDPGMGAKEERCGLGQTDHAPA